MSVDTSLFKDQIYERLWKDYCNGEKKKDTIIYNYIKNGFEEDYSNLIASNSDIQKLKLHISVRLNYYYNNIKNAITSNSKNLVYDNFRAFMDICGKNPLPKYLYDIPSDATDCDEVLNRLLTGFTPFFSLANKFGWNTDCENISKRGKLKDTIIAFKNYIDNQEYDINSFTDALIGTCLFELNSNDYTVIDRLYNILSHNSICYSIKEYFYNHGYQIDDNNNLKENTKLTSKSNSDEKASKRQVSKDETMRLIAMCRESKSFNDIFSTAKSGIGDYSAAKNLFISLINNSTSNALTKQEYENLYIPLLIDPISATSMCIIGKNHFRKYYETTADAEERRLFEACSYPLALVILNFTDVSTKGLYHSISFESYSHFYDFMLEALSAEKYYEKIYIDYLNTKKMARINIHDINLVTTRPEAAPFDSSYGDHFCDMTHTKLGNKIWELETLNAKFKTLSLTKLNKYADMYDSITMHN